MKFKMFEKVSFRLSEQTSYDLITRRKLSFSQRHDEVVVLLSQSEDQLVFVHGYTPIEGGARVLGSHRLRLTKGTWDVLKLKEYAEQVGLKVDDWSILDRAMRSAKQTIRHTLRAA
jgi:hypothetical protein